MAYTQDEIQYVADAIISSREFCGNEKEAAIDAADDLGLKCTHELYNKAKFRANNTWNNYKKEAGVSLKYRW